jgi:hypothetical protein
LGDVLRGQPGVSRRMHPLSAGLASATTAAAD